MVRGVGHATTSCIGRRWLVLPERGRIPVSANIARWGHTEGRDRRCRGNNWFVPYKTINSRAKERPHPATFPVQLAENCLRLHGVDDESLVMDPFVGIGSAARAAVNCGVQRFVGIDIDKVYLDTAINEAAAMLDGRVISGRIRKGVYDGRVKERERHAI